jgi:phospholipid/cholesterol/gamma-HCH transport system ATP-binding protein
LKLGEGVWVLIDHAQGLLRLLGQLLLDLLQLLRAPRRGPWRDVSGNLYHIGATALPITALVGFMIGIVLAYLMSRQLRQFGADTFIVNILGLALIRELGPMLAAILIAGRSGSAITAQIGVMRVTEELDAMRVMGIPKGYRLVLPRALAIALAMPLIAVWTTASAMLGGILAADLVLGVTPAYFFATLPNVVEISNLWLALGKSVLFGILIALDRVPLWLARQTQYRKSGPGHHRLGGHQHHRGAAGGRAGRRGFQERRLMSTCPRQRTPVVQIRQLWSVFRGAGRDVVIHQNLDLDIDQGEMLSIVGGSGSGKTVLLRQILGLAHPSRGSVTVLGEPAAQLGREGAASRVGMLFQHGALFSAFSVIDNIAFALRELGTLPKDLIRDAAMVKLQMVGLDVSAAHKMPADLSGGMIKRVALARALIMDPPLLLLDEPTAGLDPGSADEFCALLKALHQELGLTVVMVTHDLDTLLELSTRIAVVADKHIVALGSAAAGDGAAAPLHQGVFSWRAGSARCCTVAKHPQSRLKPRLHIPLMENKSHALAAGAFVLLMMAMLVAAAVWLTRDTSAMSPL